MRYLLSVLLFVCAFSCVQAQDYKQEGTTFVQTTSKSNKRRAVSFVEEWCNISFEGNINDFYEVSDFLADYLDTAKEIAEDAAASYWSMINGY